MTDQYDGVDPDGFARGGAAPQPDPTQVQPVYDPASEGWGAPQGQPLSYGSAPTQDSGFGYASGYNPGCDAYGQPTGGPAVDAYGQPMYGQGYDAYGQGYDAYGQPLNADGSAYPGYGQVPSGQYPPGGNPYAQPIQPQPKKSPFGRIALLVGTLVVMGALAVGGGVLQPTASPVQPLPQTTTTQGAGQSGTDDPGTQSPVGGQSGQSGTNAGTTSSGKSNATQAQTQGVVLITATLQQGSAAGTGMVIDSSGLVLTNYHVVQGSTSLKVRLASNGKNYTATVVGHDATNDVALLQLEGASGLQTVSFDEDAVNVGDKVTAVGNAGGQGYLTGASGSVTDTSASVTVSNDSASGKETLSDVYETDAQAQPGDSGGPMYDAETEVTGMTTAGEQTYAGPGQGGSSSSGKKTTVASYAIPIEKAMAIVKTIRGGQSTGTVVVGPNPYIGITVTTQGGEAVIASVSSGTPASKAGITAGSQLTQVGDTDVSSQAEIAAALAKHRPGDSVRISWTDASGKDHAANVTLGASPLN